MAGGAIISPQRERAHQYTGRFTFFTFITIICGATTGLVRPSTLGRLKGYVQAQTEAETAFNSFLMQDYDPI